MLSESPTAALTCLTRLAQRTSEAGTRFLPIALRGRELELAEVVVDVSLETGDPVGRVLAATLEATPEVLKCLERRFRDPVVLFALPLQELALTALRQLLRVRRAAWTKPDEAQSIRLGLMLNDLQPCPLQCRTESRSHRSRGGSHSRAQPARRAATHPFFLRVAWQRSRWH